VARPSVTIPVKLGSAEDREEINRWVKFAADMMGVVAEQTNRAANNMARMTKEYTDYRRMEAAFAGVMGQAPTNQFTLEQIDKAQAAGLGADQFAAYQKAIMEQIVINVTQPGGPAKQLSQKQADEIVDFTTQFGAMRQIDPGAIAQSIGGIARMHPGGARAVPEILQEWSKIIQPLDYAPGSLAKLLPELNEVLATGARPQEAATLVGIMGGRGREREAGTYARGTQRAIAHMMERIQEGKQEEDFGVTMEDTDIQASFKIYQQLKQEGIVFDPKDRNQKAIRLALSKYGFKAEEEQQALASMMNIGFEGGAAWNTMQAIQAGGVDVIQGKIAQEEGTQEGRQRRAEGRLVNERLRVGVQGAGWQLAQTEAEADLAGRSKEITPGDLLRGIAPVLPIIGPMAAPFMQPHDQQLRDQLALQRLKEQAQAAGAPAIGVGETVRTMGQALNPWMAMQAAQKLIGQIEQNTRPQVAAPPAKPVVRPGGQ
jgi:hypothetical protein